MKKKTAKKNNTDAGELHPPAVRCCSEKMRAQQKRVCSCEIIEWFSCLLPPGVPPHSSTQGDMCLRTWDKFYKRRINVRIRGDGDTCLGVMWDFFFFFFFSTSTGASIISQLWRYVLYVKCHAAHAWNPSSPLPAACFCSLCFACEAFCLYKLNSNYTTAWQSTKFVHLREAWHFGTAVNT